MIAWQPIATAGFVVLGIAALGIGAICLVSSCFTRDDFERVQATNDGFRIGALGLVLVSAAFLVRVL